jgi:hypothetical protein
MREPPDNARAANRLAHYACGDENKTCEVGDELAVGNPGRDRAAVLRVMLRLNRAQVLGSGLRILHLLLLDGLHFVDQIVGGLKVCIASFGVGFGVSLLAI